MKNFFIQINPFCYLLYPLKIEKGMRKEKKKYSYASLVRTTAANVVFTMAVICSQNKRVKYPTKNTEYPTKLLRF